MTTLEDFVAFSKSVRHKLNYDTKYDWVKYHGFTQYYVYLDKAELCPDICK